MNWEIQDGRNGFWVKVLFKDQEGYVFSGYLTKLKIPDLDITKLNCYHLEWFEKIAYENCDSLIYNGHNLIPGYDQDGKDRAETNWKVYRNGTIIKYISGYEETDIVIESTQFTMNDIMNLLDYYTNMLNSNCRKFSIANEKHLEFKVIKEESYIKRVECTQMDFVGENSGSQNIISFRIDG